MAGEKFASINMKKDKTIQDLVNILNRTIEYNFRLLDDSTIIYDDSKENPVINNIKLSDLTDDITISLKNI